jgi:hypothetical protein
MALGQIAPAIGQQPIGTIRSAALQFLLWAHKLGLLSADAYFPGDGIGDAQFDSPIPAGAIATLRQRQVRFVGINPSSLSISVYLRRTAPTAKELKVLPAACNGYALRYFQGNPQPVAPTGIAQAAATCALHTSGSTLFYTCGSSISVGNDRGAGTLGCIVRDAAGVLYGLTNNHVSASCNYAPTGLPITAPGVLDVAPGNPFPFTLGLHSHQLPMLMGDPSSVDATQNSDAALFTLLQNAPVSSMQRNHYDTPANSLDLAAGMQVEKVGRSSDRTTGVVHAEVIGALPIVYAAPQYQFSGHVYFEPLFVIYGNGDRFSEAGDSGSLVTHVDAAGVRHAVGIIVAGCDDASAPGGKRSLVLPVAPILAKLKVSLVTGHNC